MEAEKPQITTVLDEEMVLRSVRNDPLCFSVDAAGQLARLSHSAFNDRSKEPSVDRLNLLAHGPTATKKGPTDGVVSLLVADVRKISSVVSFDEKQRPVAQHAVDVVHDPLAENYAHALVRTAPAVQGDGAFRKLKEALCRIALQSGQGWVVQPGGPA